MADINVTSLVDVAFVLLIIFMITAPIMQGGVEVDLPRAQARPLEANEGMVITVNREGEIFIGDDTQLSYDDFRITFPSLVAAQKPSGVFVRGDRGAPYGDVLRVLALIRTAGVTNVGLVAQEEDVNR
jgi:biopolymer transport protein ExbD/biopolymer transport protein TolR